MTILDPTVRLRRSDASVYLKEKHGIDRSPKTLAKDAVYGTGPLIEYAGRMPLYRVAFLDEFAAEFLSPPVRSTAERASQRRAHKAA